MAHIAVGFFTLTLLIFVSTWPWSTPILLIPVLLSALIVRWRTIADRDTVTARSLLSSTTVKWEDISGLKFEKSAWARAQLRGGQELRLPAVTFATLPVLTAASGGRVPNPYAEL